jgi:hypothetical protein
VRGAPCIYILVLLTEATAMILRSTMFAKNLHVRAFNGKRGLGNKGVSYLR